MSLEIVLAVNASSSEGSGDLQRARGLEERKSALRDRSNLHPFARDKIEKRRDVLGSFTGLTVLHEQTSS